MNGVPSTSYMLQEITFNIPNYPKTISNISVSEWVDMFRYNTCHQLVEVQVFHNKKHKNEHLQWLQENDIAVKDQKVVLHGTSYESVMNINLSEL